VTVPANTTLPGQGHPRGEFAYMLDGSLILLQDGKQDLVAKKGEVAMVSFKQLYTVKSRKDGCTIFNFPYP
jgi:hypothetical protein